MSSLFLLCFLRSIPLKLKTDEFLREGGHTKMERVVTALVQKYPEALEILVKHVRECYVPDHAFVSNQVVEMWHKDDGIHALVAELSGKYSDAKNEIEFLTYFFSYGPLVLIASIALSANKIHPKDFFLVCDRTRNAGGPEATSLAITRLMVERLTAQRGAYNTSLEPIMHHTSMGFRRQALTSDENPPTYDHHDLVAAYNHFYLFTSHSSHEELPTNPQSQTLVNGKSESSAGS